MKAEYIYTIFNIKKGLYLAASSEIANYTSQVLYAMPFYSVSEATSYLLSTFKSETHKDFVIKDFPLATIIP